MILVLEKTENSHFAKFKSLLQDVAEGLDEAKDVCLNFNFMLGTINDLEESTLLDLKNLLPQAIKTITSSWILSKYYRSLPSRIIVLLKKCCFLITEKIKTSLNSWRLFKEDQKNVKDILILSIEVIDIYLSSYYESRAELQEAYENQLYPWDFPDERVFSKFEIFVHRLDNIDEIFVAADVYLNLINYKLLNVQHTDYKKRLEELYIKFYKMYVVFEECSYDPLDISSDVFTEDYKTFSKNLKELDKKLGIIVANVCLSCVPSENAFELIDLLLELLKRPLVEDEFKNSISSHIEIVYEDLLSVKQNYNNLLRHLEKGNKFIVYKNLPFVSGALQWVYDLKKKVDSSAEYFHSLEEYLRTSNTAQFVSKMLEELSDSLQKIKERLISDWENTLESLKEKLSQVLFVIDDTGQVKLNLNHEVCEITNEIEYLKLKKTTNVLPDHESKWIFEVFLPAMSLLASSIWWYQDLSRNVISQYKNLIHAEFNEIKSNIEEGYSKKWSSQDLLSYSENIYKMSKNVHENVNQAKFNVIVLEKFVETWSSSSMFKNITPGSILQLKTSAAPEAEKQKYSVRKTTSLMEIILKENQKLFNIDDSSNEWKEYMSYLESILENGLKKAVKTNLHYLVENTDSLNKKLTPLFNISVLLEEELIFKPPLDESNPKSFMKLFEAIIEMIYAPSSESQRLTDPNLNYYNAVYFDEELKSELDSLYQNLIRGCDKACSVSTEFNIYADLWLKDIDVDLQDFCIHGPITDFEVEEEVEDIDLAVTPQEIKPPSEDEFKAEVANFDQLYKNIDAMEDTIEIESWLSLDITQFKASLLLIVRKWQSAYNKKFKEMKQQGKLRRKLDDDDV